MIFPLAGFSDQSILSRKPTMQCHEEIYDLPNRPKNTATSRQPSAFFLSPCLSRPSLSVPPCAPLPQTLRAQQDFELTPGLVSREHAHNIYVQLAYPNETLLTLKLVAARERPLGPRAVALRNAKEGEGGE